jgi:AcrR family transcriptional regulator
MNNPRSIQSAKILRQGLNLLSTVGLSGVTIGHLAEQTGMSKSGLFAHFKSKVELQLSLLAEMERVVAEVVLVPSQHAPDGLPRLQILLEHWFGWSSRAGLPGGCPVAAGLFELDDQPGPLRVRLLELEQHWRDMLSGLTVKAVALGQLHADLDVDQFVWEVFGLYLSHHVSVRFLYDPQADDRARRALASLIERSSSPSRT